MYKQILEKYKTHIRDFPTARRPQVGSVIKEIRVDRGIRQMDFAKQLGLNESTLKSIENDHQKATTAENLSRIAAALGTSLEELILLGRERDPANYFAVKKSAPPKVTGILKRKRAPAEWHESIRLKFRNYDITPISPPIAMKKDFVMLRVNLPPQRAMEDLTLAQEGPVLGFISAGFNLKLGQGSASFDLTNGQGFRLQGGSPHTLRNEDEDHAAVIYLITQLPAKSKGPKKGRKVLAPKDFNIERGIQSVREKSSDRQDQMISIKHLAELSNTLDHEQIAKMMRLKKGSSVVYWEKIEDLLSATGVSMDIFLKACQGRDEPAPEISKASTRAMIDYSTYHGVKIYTATAPSAGTELFCGELLIEGKKKIGAKAWQRKDEAMIGLFVEEGELEVTVGNRRSALPLSKGESIYFDGALGYLLRNPGTHQAKAFLASSPALVF